MNGGGGRTPPLYLVAQGAQVIGADLGEQPVFEGRQDIALDDAFAHRPGAVGHLGIGQPARGHIAERPDRRQPPLLPLLLVCRGLATGDGTLGVDQLFPRQEERDAGGAVPANDDGFPAAVETIVVTKSDGACRRYRHVHAVAVGNLVRLGLGLEIPQRGVGKTSRFFLLFVTFFTVVVQET